MRDQLENFLVAIYIAAYNVKRNFRNIMAERAEKKAWLAGDKKYHCAKCEAEIDDFDFAMYSIFCKECYNRLLEIK